MDETIDFGREAVGKEENLDSYIARLSEDFRGHDPCINIGGYLGKGGFGRVFYASSSYNGTDEFALKVMKPELLESCNSMDLKEFKKRFNSECVRQYDLTQRLGHKVVKVYDYGEFMEHRFMLMELMSGNSLRRVIDNYRLYELKDRIGILKDLADILYNLHEEGFIHRDVKPENILFSKNTNIERNVCSKTGKTRKTFSGDRAIKLTDFGLMRWIAPHSPDQQDRFIVGTADYMSPEQVHDSDSADERTDQFSFGIVAYELLNGMYPRDVSEGDKRDSRNYMHKISRTPTKDIIDMNPAVEPLNNIIQRCTEINREKRYPSMADVISDLEEYCERRH